MIYKLKFQECSGISGKCIKKVWLSSGVTSGERKGVLFEVKWIRNNYQDSPCVRVSGDLSLLVDNNVYCSELAPLLLRLLIIFE